jgi:hypothetical protein
MLIVPNQQPAIIPASPAMMKREIFRAFNPPLSGADRITWPLTINGTTVDPTCVYLAEDINTGDGSWAENGGDADGAMTLQAGSPTYDVDSLFGVGGGDDEMVTGDGTTYWSVGGNEFAKSTTKDVVIEVVFVAPPTGVKLLICNVASGGVGYGMFSHAASVYGWLRSGGTVQPVYGGAAEGALVHAVLLFDYNHATRIYVNAAPGTALDVTGVGSLVNVSPLTIGAYADGTAGTTATILSAAIWQRASWLDGTSEDNVIKERFWRWTGIYPQLAPAGDYLPTFTRATTKYFYRSDQSKFHLGGSGLLAVDDTGVHIEAAATSSCLWFDPNGQWHLSGVTDDAGSASPFQGTNWSDVTETTASSAHGYSHGNAAAYASIAVDDDEYISWQVTVKAGLRRYLEFVLWESGAGHGSACFVCIDTNDWSVYDSGEVGGATKLTYVDHKVEDLGGGCYRIRLIGKNETGSLDGYISSIMGSDDAGSYTGADAYAGDDTSPAFSCVGSTTVVGSTPYYGSEILTTGSAATRNADNLDLHADIAAALNTAGQGTIECEVKLPDFDLAGNSYIFMLSDGTTNNRIAVHGAALNDAVNAYMTAGGVSQATLADTADIADDVWHTVSLSWKTNRLSLKVDGAEAVDTSCTVPSGLNELNIGRYGITNALHLNGRIRNLRIWNVARH